MPIRISGQCEYDQPEKRCHNRSRQDAATSVGPTYSASYDAAGDMTCRAPTASVTCAGTPTGAVMTYDNERRLATWQNTPSDPTSTAAYWYDGESVPVARCDSRLRRHAVRAYPRDWPSVVTDGWRRSPKRG